MGMPRERWILLPAFVVLLLAAWFSTGYHSADEFHQVIAFAGDKVQREPAEPLPWEYAKRIRSAFLPAVAAGVFAAARAIGIHDFSTWTLLLRLLTAGVAFIAVLRFTRTMRAHVPPALQHTFLLLSWFLWFLPFLHVRFTGETWSGLFLLLALAELFKAQPARMDHLRAGGLLGLAFLCRPPVVLAVGGLLCWLAIVRKDPAAKLAGLIAGFVALLVLDFAVDSWFYGEPVFTAWNYLRRGLEGSPDHDFMEYPWWYYFPWVIKYALPVVGVPILLATWLLLRFRPRHVLVWMILPFVLFHMVLPHKELRFLYPLADLMPLLLVLGLDIVMRQWPAFTARIQGKGWFTRLAPVIAAINLAALACVVFAPAGSGNTRLAAYVRSHWPSGGMELRYLAPQSEVWRIKIPAWYLPDGITDNVVNDPCISSDPALACRPLLIAREPWPRCADTPGATWKLALPAIPVWKQYALRAYDWEDAQPCWGLYVQEPGPSELPSP